MWEFTDETVYLESFRPCEVAKIPGMSRKRGSFERTRDFSRRSQGHFYLRNHLFPAFSRFLHGRTTSVNPISSVNSPFYAHYCAVLNHAAATGSQEFRNLFYNAVARVTTLRFCAPRCKKSDFSLYWMMIYFFTMR